MNSFTFYLITIVCSIVGFALLITILKDYLLIKSFRSKDLNMSYPNLIAMRIRGVNPKVIFDSSVRCQSHGIPFKIDQLECVCLSGGNLEKLTDAMIHSKNQGKLKNINIVLNSVGNSSKYGYKYGYQYGYKYGYQYAYNYGYGYGYSEDK